MKSFLKAMSVFYIIEGALALVGAVFMMAGGSILGAAGSNVTLIGGAIGLGIVFLISGILGLLVGILGLKGSKGDLGKLKAAWVLVLIAILLNLFNLISTIVAGSGSASPYLLALVIPVLFFIAATGVKKELRG